MHKLRSRLCLTVLSVVASLCIANPVPAGDFPASNTRELRLLKAKVRAAQFLSKATFGATQESIDALAERMTQIGYRRATSEWIDQQFAMPFTSNNQVASDILTMHGRTPTTQSVGIHWYRYEAWWHNALTAEDELKQKVAWALSQIFVIGDTGTGFNNDDDRSIGNNERTIADWQGMGDFYDKLGAGIDGTYRELLEEVTFHECMGVWLSSWRNRKANIPAGRWPDENYAREIMQLFSVGLYELHQDGRLKVDENGELIPTYDNSGIKELARVFTGFKSNHNTSTSFYTGRNYGDRMRLHPSEHDNNYNYTDEPDAPASKTVFGVTLPPLAQPMNEQAVKDEVDAALDVIANHPNVGPFICRLLIQRLVKSNPSRAYIRRVVRVFNDNGQGVRGDLQSVVKAILTDSELYRSQRLRTLRSPLKLEVIARGTEYSRLREPVQRVTSLIRMMRPSSNYDNNYFLLSGYNGLRDEMGQMPFRSPTVFNYYLPDFQPPGDLIDYTPSRRNPYESLFAPEFQILNGVSSNRFINRLRSWSYNRYVQNGVRVGSCRISFDLQPEMDLVSDRDPAVFGPGIDEVLRRLDLWLCSGTLSEETKQAIKDAVLAETSNISNWGDERVESILLAVLTSPDCAVEQ